MHTCPPPSEFLDKWLIPYESFIDNYGHLLLEQNKACTEAPLEQFGAYFESAHLDARQYFHELIGLDLHPDSTAAGAHASYPNNLPLTTQLGLFGEVMAGMITEHYKFIGNHDWTIPVFLFRHHRDVEEYLFALARDTDRERQVFGRTGSDFLALSINEDGEVIRFISGEAKWRSQLQKSVIDGLMLGDWKVLPDGSRTRNGKGIWNQINNAPAIPHGIRQLQRLLQENDSAGYSATILSLDRALLLRDPQPLPCTNLIFIVGNDVPSREEAHSLLQWDARPAEYTSSNDLQVVELILTDGETMIEELYRTLWTTS